MARFFLSFLFLVTTSVEILKAEQTSSHNRWYPDKKQPGSDEVRDSTADLERTTELWLDTFFPEGSAQTDQSVFDDQALGEAVAIGQILQRLFFVAKKKLTCRLQTESLDARLEQEKCHFHLAFLMSGGRVLIRFNGKTHKEKKQLLNDFLKWLLGETNPKHRLAASHGVSQNKKTGAIEEKRFKGTKGIFQSAGDTVSNSLFRKKHFYLNIPLGGLGTAGPQQGKKVGPKGFAYSTKSKTVNKKIQHGHLYIYVNRQVKAKVKGAGKGAVMMIGLEKSAPGKKSGFGDKHNLFSAMQKSGTGKTSTGGDKLEKIYKNQAPRSISGKVIDLDREGFKALKASWKGSSLNAQDKKNAKKDWRQILNAKVNS